MIEDSVITVRFGFRNPKGKEVNFGIKTPKFAAGKKEFDRQFKELQDAVWRKIEKYCEEEER